MQPIRASYRETADYYAAAAEQIPSPGFRSRLLAGCIAGIVTGGILYFERQDLWYLGAMLAGVMPLVFGAKRFRRWQFRRHYRRTVEKQDIFVEWEFADDSFCCKAGYDVAARYSWDWPKKIVQKSGGFLIQTPAKAYQWVPKTALASEGEFLRLGELMRSKARAFEVR
jgi:hypothetical protein